MRYDVRVVEDTALPAGHEWMLLEYDDRTTLAVARSADPLRVMAEAWAAYRHLTHEPMLERSRPALSVVR